MRTVGAAKFKAGCLALMDEVENKRERIVITKKGRPVAQLIPMDLTRDDDPLAYFFVGGEILGDVTAPSVPLEDYEALR